MDRSSRAFVGIDIGTSKVACAIGVLEQDALEPSIIGFGSATNYGVRKGVVADPEETASALQRAVEEAEKTSGYTVEHATVGVGGVHVKSLNSKGVIAVGGVNREINPDDVARVEEAATVVQLPTNREIVQVFSQQYRLDNQDAIKDPVGMSGVRLEVDAHIITAASPAIKNLQKCLYTTGIHINQLEAISLAASRAVLDKRQREYGTALIDIGASTTSIAVFEEGEIIHTTVIPIGSGHITNDLAIGFQTDLDTAETIKCKHIDLTDHNGHKGATVKSVDGESLAIDLNYGAAIACARSEELFELVGRELEKIKRARKLPGGVVLVGGGANQKGVVETAKRILALPVTLGRLHGFSGMVDQVQARQYAAVVGLMLDDILLEHLSTGHPARNITKHFFTAIQHLIKRVRP